MSHQNHKSEQTSPRPEQNFYQSTDVTPNNSSSKYFKSKYYVDDKGNAERDVKRNDADKRVDNDDKVFSDGTTHDYDYNDTDDDDGDDSSSMSVADDRIDADVNDVTYDDDDGYGNDNDQTSEKVPTDKNVTTKPEYDYVYYYYYDYIDPDDVGRAGHKKTPKHFEVLPNPSYLVGVDADATETTLEDELTTSPSLTSSDSTVTSTPSSS